MNHNKRLNPGQDSKRSVIIMNLNHIGLGIARNLSSDKSLRLIGLTNKENYACQSKYIEHYLIINFELDEKRAIDWFIKTGKNLESRGFIFPTSEIEIEFLLKYKKKLNNYYELSLPVENVLKNILDKYSFSKLIKSCGFDTPDTFFIKSIEEIKKVTSSIPSIFPCVLKPAFSGDWKTNEAAKIVGPNKAIVVHNDNEVIEKFKILSQLSPNLILQKLIKANEEDTYSFCCYADKNGDVLWGCVSKKLLQYPKGFGTAVISKIVQNKAVFEYGKKLIESIGLDGISEVEIMKESKTGKLQVIEINTRHWQQHIISTKAGMNLSLLDLYYRTGQKTKYSDLISIGGRGPESGIWIDDMGYMIHCIKQFFRPSACCFDEIKARQIIFSVFSFYDPKPFLYLLKERLFFL